MPRLQNLLLWLCSQRSVCPAQMSGEAESTASYTREPCRRRTVNSSYRNPSYLGLAMSRDFIGYGRHYPRVEWPDKAQIAVSLVVNYEVGAESSVEESDPTAERMSEVTGIWPVENRRDFTVESTYQYESRVAVWRLFDLFDEYNVKTTFFACGQALEKTPEVAREITSRDHEPCSHGYRWVERHLRMNRDEERQEIRRTVEAIKRTTGERPYGWFYLGGPTLNTRELLAEEEFLYDSHAFDDEIPYTVKAAGRNFVSVPYSNDVNDFHFWLNRFSRVRR